MGKLSAARLAARRRMLTAALTNALMARVRDDVREVMSEFVAGLPAAEAIYLAQLAPRAGDGDRKTARKFAALVKVLDGWGLRLRLARKKLPAKVYDQAAAAALAAHDAAVLASEAMATPAPAPARRCALAGCNGEDDACPMSGVQVTADERRTAARDYSEANIRRPDGDDDEETWAAYHRAMKRARHSFERRALLHL